MPEEYRGVYLKSYESNFSRLKRKYWHIRFAEHKPGSFENGKEEAFVSELASIDATLDYNMATIDVQSKVFWTAIIVMAVIGLII